MSLKQTLTTYDAASKFRESEINVITAVGGIKNPALSRFFQRTITANIKASENKLTIPDGAGTILKVLVDGEPFNIVSPKNRSSHKASILNSRSAIVDGNKIEILGIKSDRYGQAAVNSVVEIVVENPVVSTVYIDGLFAYQTYLTIKEGGKQSLAYVIDRPTHEIFKDDFLFGGTLRVVADPAFCNDYTIITNKFIGRNVIYVQTTPIQSPVSWIRHSTYETTDITGEDKIKYPELRNISSRGNLVYPAMVARTMLPENLRHIALVHSRWLVTKNAAYFAEYNQLLNQWLSANGS